MADQYYGNLRSEMLEFLPQECSSFLEVGCGRGLFGAQLKQQKECSVWGAELFPEAAAEAVKALDNVIVGDFEKLLPQLPAAQFDCAIFNDALEHLADPFAVLRGLKPALKPGGYIVGSIPNVRYIGNLKELLIDRDWRYKPEGGILDITHLRFFTRKSIHRMFTEAGYTVTRLEGINANSSLKFKLLNLMTLGWLSDTKYVQWAVVAKLSI